MQHTVVKVAHRTEQSEARLKALRDANNAKGTESADLRPGASASGAPGVASTAVSADAATMTRAEREARIGELLLKEVRIFDGCAHVAYGLARNDQELWETASEPRPALPIPGLLSYVKKGNLR